MADEKNKDKDEKKDKDRDVDEEIRQSGRERDAARRNVTSQAERRRKSKSDIDRIIDSSAMLTLNDRVELLERTMLKPLGKAWRHPIHVTVRGGYHKCAACNGKIADEVVTVVERKRSGDRIHVFCGKECLNSYDGW